MRQVLRRAVVAAAVGSMLLTGCATTVVGTAAPGAGVPKDVAANAFPITGATGNPVDQFARDALADLNTFWAKSYPKFFGGAFQPLRGGYFSVNSKNVDPSVYPPTGIGCPRSPTDPEEVAGNAFYDPKCDLIAYDRDLVKELTNDYGRFLAPVVMAHEFGHAIQARYGGPDQSIEAETQADCFAGAWTRWVADGNAQHVALRVPELDDVLRGFLLLRDPVGEDPTGQQAHGSYFDRISGFYDGYDGGVARCRDAFGPDRVFTQAPFTSEQDYQDQGNAPYSETLKIVDDTLPPFWTNVFPSAFAKRFRPPKLQSFQGNAPSCADRTRAEVDLAYCAKDSTVYYDESGLIRPAYQDIGDFAVATAISLPYALAVRSELGRSTDDAAAEKSAVCLTGWYAAQVYDGEFKNPPTQITLSPGDIDESVEFILEYGVSDKVFPNTSESGFELVGAFRDGFLKGGKSCDVGL